MRTLHYRYARLRFWFFLAQLSLAAAAFVTVFVLASVEYRTGFGGVLTLAAGAMMLYLALVLLLHSRLPILELSNEGLRYRPIPWLLRPRLRYIRWIDIVGLRFFNARASAILEIRSRPGHVPRDRHREPAIRTRIQTALLDSPPHKLLAEMRVRAAEAGNPFEDLDWSGDAESHPSVRRNQL